MIIYENTKEKFIDEVIKGELTDTILDLLKDKHIGGVNTSQISAFNNSLRFVKDVLDTEDIPNDCQVAIEYNIPQTSKRVDFMILGKDTNGQDNVVIIELKQWSTVSKVDDTFKHTVHSDLLGGSDSAHPSYQAYSYKTLLLNYCEHGFVSKDSLIPCAYLHNMSEAFRPVLEDTIYKEWIDEAPVFLRNDLFKLREFIKKYIRHKSNNGDLLYKIDYGKIKPQKSLQDSLDSMLCGNEEFKMIDEQVVAFDIIMNAVKQAQKDHKKHVVIIKGGPGTGKSVLAINVLCECISKLGLNASYITKNSAPRNCYLNLLSKGNAKKALDLKLAIMSPHAIPSLIDNAIDVGLFDEAHRLQKKPFMYRGNDLLMDLLATCQTSVFFIDENQKITTKDCYDIETIIRYATSIGAKIDTPIPYELSSQFRCGGSDGYIAFVDNLLGIRQTANYVFDDKDFDLRIFDNPNELREEIRKRNKTSRARMVAG